MKDNQQIIYVLDEIHDYLLEKADTVIENDKPYFNKELVMADKVWNLMHDILSEKEKDSKWDIVVNLTVIIAVLSAIVMMFIMAWDIVTN